MNNDVEQRGAPFQGQYSHCVGGSRGNLVDTTRARVTGNRFIAQNLPPLGLVPRRFPDQASAFAETYASLFHADRLAIAFRLLRRATTPSENNIPATR